MSIELGTIIAVVGCLVGLAGWLRNRDKQTTEDAEWRGQVNAKLDVIVGIRNDVDDLDEKVGKLTERVVGAEKSVASAHKRLDEHFGGRA